LDAVGNMSAALSRGRTAAEMEVERVQLPGRSQRKARPVGAWIVAAVAAAVLALATASGCATSALNAQADTIKSLNKTVATLQTERDGLKAQVDEAADLIV